MRLNRAWRRRLLFVGALYFTFFGGTFTTDHSFGPRVAHHVLVTLLLATWLLVRLRRPELLSATALDAPLIAYFAAYALATAFAVDPRISLEFLWRLGVHIWLYYVMVGLFAGGHGRDVLEALYLASAVVVLIGAFEFASWYFGLSIIPGLSFQQGWPEIGGLAHPVPPNVHRLNFTLGFSTGLSAYFAALIPFGLSIALTGRDSETRRAFWLWLVGALVVEGLSFSRGGLLSLAVSLPLFALLALWGDAERRARLRRWVADSPKGVIVGGLLLVAVVGVIGLGWTSQFVASHRSGDAVRVTLWRSALLVFRDHPLTGVGPYGFGRALRSVRVPPIVTDRYLTADNRLFTTLAEAGLPGGLALLWLGARFLWMGYHRWRAARGAAQLRLAAACAGVIGFGLHNLVDTFTATPLLLPLFVLVAYVATRGEQPARAWPDRRRAVARVFVAAALAVVALSALGWLVSDRAQAHFERSLRLAGGGDLNAALAEVDHARAIDPALGLYVFQRANLLGRLAGEDSVYVDDAIQAYEAALAREGTYDLHRANLAALYAQAGRLEDAQAEMEAAYAIQSNGLNYLFWLGAYAEQAGDTDAAAEGYALALSRRPEWASSPYWEADEWSAEFFSGQVALATEEGDVAFLLAAGDVEAALEAARAAARPGDSGAQLTLGEVALRARQPEEALTALDAALDLNPASAWAYAWRAEAKLALGDLAGAGRDARTALFLDATGGPGRRGHYVLAQLAERGGDWEAAEAGYLAAGPVVVVGQGWDVSVYGRKADFRYLPQLQTPGDGPTVLEPWLALAHLYEGQGRAADAEAVYEAIRFYDPYFGG